MNLPLPLIIRHQILILLQFWIIPHHLHTLWMWAMSFYELHDIFYFYDQVIIVQNNYYLIVLIKIIRTMMSR